ncbi:MAG TPA: EAL domain-containing protein [Noviherbaspirillum sp.]|nr:EAL domain-containing protein [Noviherbaspirillum sp.]
MALQSSPGTTWWRILRSLNLLPLIIFDATSLKILMANHAAGEFYGFAQKDWKERSILDLHVQSDTSIVRGSYATSLSAHARALGKWRHQKKNGAIVLMNVFVMPVSFGNKRIAMLIPCEDQSQDGIGTAFRQTEVEMQNLQELFALGSWRWDIAEAKVHLSTQALLNFGMIPPINSISFADFMMLTHHEDRAALASQLEEALDHQAPFSLEHRVVWPDNSIHVVQERGYIIADQERRATALVAGAIEITAQRSIEQALRQTENDLNKAQEIAHVGSWVWDIRKDVRTWSDETCRILGFAPHCPPRNSTSFLEIIHPEDREAHARARQRVLDDPNAEFDIECRVVHRDGSVRCIHAMGKVERDATGTPIKMIGTVQDITDKKEAEERIHRLAFFDSITGLPNRVQLRHALGSLLQSPTPQPIALLLIDIGRFSEIAYTLGSANAESLLRDVAARISSTCEGASIVARVGQTEFGAVYAGPGAYLYAKQVRQIHDSFFTPFGVRTIEYELGVKIGVALAPGQAADVDTLLRKAEVALSQARQSDRNFAVYHPDEDPYRPQRLVLLGEFRKAVHEGQLMLYCQPKADLRTGEIHGAEALVRWVHPTLGLISPSQFIPLIEPTELVHVLSRFMLQEAVKHHFSWEKQGIRLPLAVNLSARNLCEAGLEEYLQDLLQTWGGDPEWVGLEITENSLMEEAGVSIAKLQSLSDKGFRLFIDDFGIGYSSLSYLMRLPVDVIKIDQCFTSRMLSDRGAASIVKSTIELAHNLGLEVVAEGAENRETWNALQSIGCDEAQGYFISRPLPGAEFPDWLSQWRAVTA